MLTVPVSVLSSSVLIVRANGYVPAWGWAVTARRLKDFSSKERFVFLMACFTVTVFSSWL